MKKLLTTLLPEKLTETNPARLWRSLFAALFCWLSVAAHAQEPFPVAYRTKQAPSVVIPYPDFTYVVDEYPVFENGETPPDANALLRIETNSKTPLRAPASAQTTNPDPVDCVVSAWSNWSNCTVSCGGGIQTRTREIVTPPANGGQPCPPLSETQACNEYPCPVDCVVGPWSNWSNCTVSCGGGVQTRTRNVVTYPANGGLPCPTLLEARACNTQPCPVDCVVSPWGNWSTCTKICGGGIQTRTRNVVTPAANGGLPCPVLSETQPCNQQPCPVDCVVSDWSVWSTCSAPCGGGVQTRTRNVITPAAYGGVPCPTSLSETQPCNQQPCCYNYYTDADNDGYGTGAAQFLCSDPGPGYSLQNGDCNDNDGSVNPGIAENCGLVGTNSVDDDCDGTTDEDISAPTVTCKNTGIALDDAGMASLTSGQILNGTSDNCTASPSIAFSPNMFDCANAGPNTVTITATDDAGNSASCTANVLVVDVLYYSQTAAKNASNAAANDKFGWGMALEGSIAAVGAPDKKVGTQSKQGAAYLFNGASAWAQFKTLTATGGAAVDYFGNAIDLDGQSALVGAYGDNVGANADQGSVYVFDKDYPTSGAWGQVAQIFSSDNGTPDGAAYDYFGNAVSLKNGRAIIGASKKKVGSNNAQGAAYIYEKDTPTTGAWGIVKKLTASDGAANNFFGVSVAQSGSLALVGANGHNNNRGAAYFFDGANAWAQGQKLTASDAATGDGFGTSISLTSDYALIGAPNKAGYMGAAYVFRKGYPMPGQWGQIKKLVPADGAANDKFGTSVALSNDYAYVSAVKASSGVGAVYVFHKDVGGKDNWGQVGKYTATGGANGDQFGYNVAADGEYMAAAANLADLSSPTRADAGKLYIFTGEGCPDVPRAADGATSRSQGLVAAPTVACSPNPFRGDLVIRVESNSAARLQVTDAAGRPVTNVDLPAGQVSFTLDGGRLPAGLYFVQVSTEGGVQVQPVVKM
ncbi:MAG: T9SS type A sorting domain-containing protein [Saprospiraceae bacterium]